MAKGKDRNRTRPDRVKAAERALEVVELRKRGKSYAEIRRETGYSKTRISQILNAHVDDYAQRHKDELDELRNLENARLDAYLMKVHDKAMDGDLFAIDRALKIMDRRAKLLGLDAPSKIAPTDPSGEGEYQGGGLSGLVRTMKEKLGEHGG